MTKAQLLEKIRDIPNDAIIAIYESGIGITPIQSVLDVHAAYTPRDLTEKNLVLLLDTHQEYISFYGKEL